jgi:DNA primase
VAGRINTEDLELVRERAKIEDIVGAYVTLRRSGSDLSGLCPFHDEKTPSFHVTPSRGLYYCFGCGAGGDVVDFERRINNLSFTEAVQLLADKTGVQLRFTDDGGGSNAPGLRSRLLAANQAAAEFFAQQLTGPEAIAARQMLDARGFDQKIAQQFGVGYAPKGGRELHQYLNRRGFTDQELTKASLIRENGGWDFFQGRVLWPIRDSAGSVLGFGARRLYDDDRLPAKYINTAETPVYKKSQVLYGLDLARVNIGKQGQAVVMEGYTDVMAAHLSGITTAVASCGTAFGAEHAKLLQRLIGNGGTAGGEVVFTFDGDAAGQKAAMKVYSIDSQFDAQTYVAVAPDGLDPCDLRLQRGETALRDLIGTRIPLYRFVMRNLVSDYNLDHADGRLNALRAAAGLVSSIRDETKVEAYLRELANVVGVDIDEVRSVVKSVRKQHRNQRPVPPVAQPGSQRPVAQASMLPYPDPNHPGLAAERGVLKLMLQVPTYFTTDWNAVEPEDFRHPAYRAVFETIMGTPFSGTDWTNQVQQNTTDPTAHQLEIELLVEPLLRDPDERYASAYSARVRLPRIMTALKDAKSRLQRTNPVEDPTASQQLLADVLSLESIRKQLQQESLGFDE